MSLNRLVVPMHSRNKGVQFAQFEWGNGEQSLHSLAGEDFVTNATGHGCSPRFTVAGGATLALTPAPRRLAWTHTARSVRLPPGRRAS